MGKKNKAEEPETEDLAPGKTKGKKDGAKADKKRKTELAPPEQVPTAGKGEDKKKRKSEATEKATVETSEKESRKRKESKVILVTPTEEPTESAEPTKQKKKIKNTPTEVANPAAVVSTLAENPPKEQKKQKKSKSGGAEANGTPAVEAMQAPVAAEAKEEDKAKKSKKKKGKQGIDDTQPIASKSALVEDEGRPVANGNQAEPEAEPDKKKRKKQKTGSKEELPEAEVQAVVDVVQQTAATPQFNSKPNTPNGSGTGGTGTGGKAFQRVKAEEWLGKRGAVTLPEEYTKAQSGGWAKAQQTLDSVRGRDFRREKTKMKRTNFRNGSIDAGARFSYKFDSDEE